MWLQNQLNSVNARPLHLANSIQLVFVLIITMVSFNVAMEYPLERNQLVFDDNNILLSPNFLPFLNNCTGSNPQIALCAMYYDTVYNVYKYGHKGDEVKAEMLDADKKFENPQLIDQFCNMLVNESAIALDKQPFSEKNNLNITEWIRLPLQCPVNCLYPALSTVKVKQECIYIYSGCRWIVAQKRKQALIDAPAVVVKPEQEQNPNSIIKLDSNSKPNSKPNSNPNSNPKPTINTNTNQLSIPNGSSIVQSIDKKEIISDNEKNQNQNEQPIPIANINSNAILQKSIITSTKPSKETDGLKAAEDLVQPAAVPPKAVSVTPKLDKSTNEKQIKSDLHPIQPIEAIQPIQPIQPNQPNQPNQPDKTIETGQKASIPSNQNEEDEAYNVDQRTDLENDQKPNEDDPDNERDDVEEDSRELQSDIKSNNIAQAVQSVQNVQKDHLLLAEVPDFREDKESSFFPYFMFFMFVVVSFYVAYHNKSKILALLIEGRRSRSYSSRGGGRRKQHSAEYRKLDSNLEEAIQSDGGHVLSTQIIY